MAIVLFNIFLFFSIRFFFSFSYESMLDPTASHYEGTKKEMGKKKKGRKTE
jgi:hypothetical protein